MGALHGSAVEWCVSLAVSVVQVTTPLHQRTHHASAVTLTCMRQGRLCGGGRELRFSGDEREEKQEQKQKKQEKKQKKTKEKETKG